MSATLSGIDPAQRRRGQPLIVLLALLLGWTGARVTALGEAGGVNFPEAVLSVGTATAAQATPEQSASLAGPQSYAAPTYAGPTYSGPAFGYMPMPGYPMGYGAPAQYMPIWPAPHRASPPRAVPAGAPGPALASSGGEPWAFGYSGANSLSPQVYDQDVSTAGFPPLSRPVPGLRYGEAATLLGGRIGRLIGDPGRWSMDAWALLRDDKNATPQAGTLPATYGASQAGAVLRYRLSMQSPHRPSAYLRTTSTLGSLNETALALGLSARPLARIPIVAAVEGRVVDQAGDRRVQPAVMAVTELPALALPGALRAELYAQGGYVGGRYATPFADGQLRVDRSVLTHGRAEARLGAGAWGGIQEGASRLDAGPGLTLSAPLSSKVFGRLAVDWRFRVAGDAEPGSGPAMTVAAGF